MALLLDESDVAHCLDMASLIPLMRETLARFSRGETAQPVRSSMRIKPAMGFYGIMPAHVPGPGDDPGAFGLKSVCFFPGNDALGLPTHLATVLLLDPRNGNLIALMDGRLITEMRTAAVSAVSVDLLARRGSTVLGILGSGVQARSHLEAINLVRPLTHVRVWSRRLEHAQTFVRDMLKTVRCPISAVSTPAEAVKKADVVVTATSATDPILFARDLEPGQHLAVVGSSAPRMRELDGAAVARCRVWVDTRDAARVEAGDLLIAEKEGHITASHVVGELGDVANDVSGRQSDDEITMFKSLGMGVEDVATAQMVVQRARQLGIGRDLTILSTTPRDARLRLLIAFACVYVIWGSTYLAIRIAIETIPPLLMAGVRFLVAGSVLTLWARSRGATWPDRAQWRTAAVVGLLMLVGGNGLVVWAELTVPSALAALIVAAVPIVTVALDWARPGGVRPGRATILGLLTGFAGVAILVNPFAADASRVDPLGAVALLVATVCWAAGSIYSRGAPASTSPLMGSGANMLMGGVGLVIGGALIGEVGRVDFATISTRSALAMLYLIVMGAIVGFTAFFYILHHAAPATATTYAYVNPIVAIVLGWAILNEPITARVLLAAAVIISGVVMITALPHLRARLARH